MNISHSTRPSQKPATTILPAPELPSLPPAVGAERVLAERFATEVLGGNVKGEAIIDPDNQSAQWELAVEAIEHHFKVGLPRAEILRQTPEDSLKRMTGLHAEIICIKVSQALKESHLGNSLTAPGTAHERRDLFQARAKQALLTLFEERKGTSNEK